MAKRNITLPVLSIILVIAMCGSIITVSAAAPARISMKKNMSISVGQKKKINVKITPVKAKTKIKWKSKKPQIAGVSKKGVVKGKKTGKTVITASIKYKGRKLSAKCTVKVKKKNNMGVNMNVNTNGNSVNNADSDITGGNLADPLQNLNETEYVKVTAITANIERTNLIAGESVQISAQVQPENASVKSLKYISSDPAVVTVSDSGTVTAISKGTASVAVISDDADDVRYTFNITVIAKKPRTIITTDGECDDSNSLIHCLLFSDEIDIEGIVLTSSCWHWQGGKKYDGSTVSSCRWPGYEWMFDMIDAYEEVYPNLLVHSPYYPEPDYLRDITKIGNTLYEGEMEDSTEGSDLIKKCILDDVPGYLYLEAWGGTNTIAVALRDIEDEYKNTPDWEDIYDKVSGKVIITACGKQDDTYDNYIAVSWPDIPFVNAEDQSAYGYATKDNGSDEMKRTMSSGWMYENIEKGHGPLLDLYITWGDGTELPYEPEGCRFGTNDSLLNQSSWMSSKGYDRYDFLSEGDSPTYFAFFDTGLRAESIEEFAYGGYAGRYVRKAPTEAEPNFWELQRDNDHVLGLNGSQISLMKWIPDIQHNFAVRADWCITPEYENANHRPDITVMEGNEITAKAGETITLNAVVSDPDGDNVYVSWWNYAEAGTYKAASPIDIKGADTETATFTIPSDAKEGDTIHIIARAEDDGEHNLAYHQRVIINIVQ